MLFDEKEQRLLSRTVRGQAKTLFGADLLVFQCRIRGGAVAVRQQSRAFTPSGGIEK